MFWLTEPCPYLGPQTWFLWHRVGFQVVSAPLHLIPLSLPGPPSVFKSTNLYAERWRGCLSCGALLWPGVPDRAISVMAHSAAERWYERGMRCVRGASVLLKGPLKCCNVIMWTVPLPPTSDPIAWNAPAAAFQSVGLPCLFPGGGLWSHLKGPPLYSLCSLSL